MVWCLHLTVVILHCKMISSSKFTFEVWDENSPAGLSYCVLRIQCDMINILIYLRGQNLFFWKPKLCNPALVKPVCPVWEKVVTSAAVTELIPSWVSFPSPPGGLSYSESRQSVFSLLQNHTLSQEQTLSLRTQGPRTGVRFQGLACHPLGEEPGSFPVTEEPEVQTLSPGGFDQARLCRYVFGD